MKINDSTEAKASLTALTVLLVEDDSLISSVLEYLFVRHGFVVRVAIDGLEAQAIIQSNEAPPDIAVFDLMLPYLDGYELLQMMKKRPKWDKVPVIVLSGKAQEEDAVRAFKLGAADYIVKPFQPNELIARMLRLIN
jgi:two-component system, OmpR family, alkaline phosphatase synthesis response regulator PhoP